MDERRLTDAEYAELAADYAANPVTANEVATCGQTSTSRTSNATGGRRQAEAASS
ncbi:hypothetical protein MTY66_57780 [Mycolicibacterium sp. TY66]|uniref:hypothetical protein n=1 Tax=unclassified Mycolicibacterium TaxID=2636767 RepID=UPI001BB3EF10|nr:MULTISPECIES: hypothetical protein [unclassified Mycolicibacterium]BCI84153.1 hypothetical protein MTY66_57780 [Mycolicibacterium sp. TY66]BCJ84227.1 hypothetical protein MTY81_56000 [Mycolicibacterium sp. TY81]